ncbi:MAG: NAD(P)-dependent oxidoreductase [Bacteroidota bacterium]
MKIGIIREGKVPPDSRVPLTPEQCKHIVKQHPVQIVVQPSPNRCYKDEEYTAAGLPLTEDLSDCDVLMGVKEVPIDQLLANKRYFFFSHTIKEQAYNRSLLLAILDKSIQLIDYEVLTDDRGRRLIAFGKFAGMVGAHNAMVTYGARTGAFTLQRMKDCYDYAEAKSIYKKITWPPVRIVLTGTGRVGMGAAQVLRDMGILQVPSQDFLSRQFGEAVFTQLECEEYVQRKDGEKMNRREFFNHPEDFESSFAPFTKVADIMINGIYWDNNAPAFFSKEDMKQEDFNIEVIADVTCDIAPVSSIPSTLRASTIADPFFGYDPKTEAETAPFQENSIDMMTIDNLPNELPRDASASFGEQFTKSILPELLKPGSAVIERATVAKDGQLGKHFGYLSNYVAGIAAG